MMIEFFNTCVADITVFSSWHFRNLAGKADIFVVDELEVVAGRPLEFRRKDEGDVEDK